MKPVLVLYAAHLGHSERIADYIARALNAHDLVTHVVNASSSRAGFSPSEYSAAILIAPVHGTRPKRDMVEFVQRHRTELERIPTAFVSVGLTEAAAAFLAETDWRPAFLRPVAGALDSREHNFFMRYRIRQIARKSGRDMDPSRDYEDTDWKALDRLVEEVVPAIREPVLSS